MLENQLETMVEMWIKDFQRKLDFDNKLSNGKIIKALRLNHLWFEGCVLKEKG